MFEPVKFCCICCLELQGRKSKRYFQNFVQIVPSLESKNCNVTTNDWKPKNYRWTLWLNQYGEKQNRFAEVATFCQVTLGISTDFYYKKLIEIGAKPAFSIHLAPGLICEGYWQVNSQRLIFRIAEPTYESTVKSVFLLVCLLDTSSIIWLYKSNASW